MLGLQEITILGISKKNIIAAVPYQKHGRSGFYGLGKPQHAQSRAASKRFAIRSNEFFGLRKLLLRKIENPMAESQFLRRKPGVLRFVQWVPGRSSSLRGTIA